MEAAAQVTINVENQSATGADIGAILKSAAGMSLFCPPGVARGAHEANVVIPTLALAPGALDAEHVELALGIDRR
jgi:hypothetical protein